MNAKLGVAILMALQLAATGAALAADAPVNLNRSQLMMQDQETHVLNLLSAAGYTDIGMLEHGGQGWTTTATKDGKSMQVVVDPMSGTINGM